MNDCWRGCRWSPSNANPSMVTIWASWCATARARQLVTRRPSSKTVQAPHCPWSQPFFVPVRPSRSRSASSSVVRVSITSGCVAPFTRRVISSSIVDVSPLVASVTSCDADKDSLQSRSASEELSAFNRKKKLPNRLHGLCARPIPLQFTHQLNHTGGLCASLHDALESGPVRLDRGASDHVHHRVNLVPFAQG